MVCGGKETALPVDGSSSLAKRPGDAHAVAGTAGEDRPTTDRESLLTAALGSKEDTQAAGPSKPVARTSWAGQPRASEVRVSRERPGQERRHEHASLSERSYV